MAKKILLPPGRTQKISCPEGNKPAVEQGDLLPNKKEAKVYIVKVDGQDIYLGPISAGQHELPQLCLGLEQSWTLEVVAPDPKQVEKNFQPVSPTQLLYPSWIWLALAVVVALSFLLGFIIVQIKRNKDSLKSLGKKGRIRKTPIQKMEAFFVKVKRDNIIESTDTKSASFLYGDGIKHLRPLIQQALGFKAPGATRKEFIIYIKDGLRKHPQLLTPQKTSLLESLFMQSSQVDYSDDTPSPQLKSAFQNQLKEFSSVFIEKIKADEVQANPKGKKRKAVKKIKREAVKK